MTILKVILVVVTLSSVAYAQQGAIEDLTLAASKGKRHISQLEAYGSLQFHKPPLPSIDYYGESDKGHGGYIVLSHEKGKGHKSKGKGGGGYEYDSGYSNGYAVSGGDSSESHGNGGGSFGGSYYVAKTKGKGKGGYPSKGKGGSYGGKGKGGYAKGKGTSYGKGKGSYGGKGKGSSYGGKGKGGSYGGKGQGGIPYGSGGYNPYGSGGGGGPSENNGNGGYLYVSGAISNSYGGSGIGGNSFGSSGIGGILHESGGIGGNSHGSSGIEGNLHGSSGIGENSYGSSGIGGNSYGSTGMGYNSFGSSQSGGSSSENSGGVLSAYGGVGSQANIYSGGGTQDSAYGGGGVADNYGLGAIGGSYPGGGVGDSYGGGGVDDSYGIGGTDDLYGGGVVNDSYGIGGVDDSYSDDGVGNSYGGGGVDDSFGGGGVGDLYGTGGADDSYGGGGGNLYSYGGNDATGGGSGGVGIPETSAIVTRGADSGTNTELGSGTDGTASTRGSTSLGGGGRIAESTGKKRSPSDTDETADKLSESNAAKSTKSGRKANTNDDAESNAKTTVNYNLSINANGDASAANVNGNNNTVKVDIKTDGKAENAFSVSVHISSGGNGNSPSVKNYASPTSPPIVIQPSSVKEVDKLANSGGSSPGTKRSIALVSMANQETFNSGEKSKKEAKNTPKVTKEQVKNNKPAKPIPPLNNPIKFNAPDGNSSKPSAPKTFPSKANPPSSTSAKPGSPSSIPERNVNVEKVLQQVKGRNETRTNRTTTPLPLQNTAGSNVPNATEEQSSIGCTSGCFSIPPVVDPSIRGQANNSTKSNSSITSTPGRTRKGREHVITDRGEKSQSPTGNGSSSNSGKSSASKDVPKGEVQAEVTSGIAVKGSNASGNTGKDRMRLIGSTASFINIPGGGNNGFESVQHLKNGEGRRNVGTANSTRVSKHTGTPTIEDIHSFFGFRGNGNKDLKSPRSAHKNETKSATSSTNVTVPTVARHNLRPRPTTVTTNTTSSAGIKKENTKGFGIGKSVPTTGGKRNATFPIDVRLNTTRQPITQRPRPAVDILPISGRPIMVDVPSWIVGRNHRGLDTIGNGTKSSLKTKNEPNRSPVQFSPSSPTYNPIPITEDELSFHENAPTNAGKDGQVRSTAPIRDERAGVKGNSNPSVEAPMIVPFLNVDTYYIPLRRFIRQKQTQRP